MGLLLVLVGCLGSLVLLLYVVIGVVVMCMLLVDVVVCD